MAVVIEIAPFNVGYCIPSVMPITGARPRPGAIPSGFCNTVTVLVTFSGALPARSDGAEYTIMYVPAILEFTLLAFEVTILE